MQVDRIPIGKGHVWKILRILLGSILFFTPGLVWAHDKAPDEKTALETSQIQLLRPGLWRAQDVRAQDGELWLGLFKAETGSNKFLLIPVHIRVKSVFDPEHAMSNQTGYTDVRLDEILTTRYGQSIVLVKGLTDQEPRPVSTVFHGFKPFWEDAQKNTGPNQLLSPQTVILDPHHRLIADLIEAHHANTPGSSFLKGMLTYVEHERAQLLTIPSIPVKNSPKAGLIWAGDLDQDGYLDLLMTLSPVDTAFNITLFLSSQADSTKGDLLKNVGEWTGHSPIPLKAD